MQDKIEIINAQQHNLKNVNVTIQHGSFTVVTGVSGSGKSSLVFDTLFAEGQRRYIESLSSYARQFMGRMKKPNVEYINGLCPAVAIEQKVNTKNSRSTLATSTEIYDYLKLIFARIGRTFSPISNNEVKSHTTLDVLNFCLSKPENETILILAPLKSPLFIDEAELLMQKGFTRLFSNNEIQKLQITDDALFPLKNAYLVIDRFILDGQDETLQSRIVESATAAFWEGKGECIVFCNNENTSFNDRFELDGMVFEKPTKDFLSFNNPYGACKTCDGFGTVLGLDKDLIIPDTSLSVYAGAVAAWNGDTMSQWKKDFCLHIPDFPVHKPYEDLSTDQKNLLWNGSKKVQGIYDFFKFVDENSYKIQYRVLSARYRGKTSCPDCLGTRLRKDAGYVFLVDVNTNVKKNMQEVLLMDLDTAALYFEQIQFNEYETQIVQRILLEINQRLQVLKKVGLGYLGLNRLSNTLSGGESQRINLATSLGSSLTGSLYVLDEPSIGLHSRDTERLIEVLKDLQAQDNTIVIVEHDEDVMYAADDVIDMGPEAGSNGGNVMYQGKFKNIASATESLTAKYITQTLAIEIPLLRRKWKHSITIEKANAHNLKNVTVKIPLDVFTVVTGVSGSGKTSLIKNILYPALAKSAGVYVAEKTLSHKQLSGDKQHILAVEMVDQNPIGKSSRSNPVTYVKAYDDIRDLFSKQQQSTILGLKPSHFSFNVEGGRCDNCMGDGETVIEMQFMADIKLTCDACQGMRFKREVLSVEYAEKNINDVLNLTVDDAIILFEKEKNVVQKLLPLQQVGLGYVCLGQNSSTLSGGEAQRVKLAFFLSKVSPYKNGNTMFIFDEPTTGLHFNDIKKLLLSFNALIEKGNTIVCIEHNMDVIKTADWLIDMGPEAGVGGGQVVFEGTPEDLIKTKLGHTARYLKTKMLQTKPS